MAFVNRAVLWVLLVCGLSTVALAQESWGKIIYVSENNSGDGPYDALFYCPYDGVSSSRSITVGWRCEGLPDPAANGVNPSNTIQSSIDRSGVNVPTLPSGNNPIFYTLPQWGYNIETNAFAPAQPFKWPPTVAYNGAANGYFRFRARVQITSTEVYWGNWIYAWARNGYWSIYPPSQDTGWTEYNGNGQYGDGGSTDGGKVRVFVMRQTRIAGDGVHVKLTRTGDGATKTIDTVNGYVTFNDIASGPYSVTLSGQVLEDGNYQSYTGTYAFNKPAGDYSLNITTDQYGHFEQTEDNAGGDDHSWFGTVMNELFVPSEAKVTELKNGGSGLVNWGPFGFITDLLSFSATGEVYEPASTPGNVIGPPGSSGWASGITNLVMPVFDYSYEYYSDKAYKNPKLTYEHGGYDGITSGIGAPPVKVSWNWLSDSTAWATVRFLMGLGVFVGFGMFLLKRFMPKQEM